MVCATDRRHVSTTSNSRCFDLNLQMDQQLAHATKRSIIYYSGLRSPANISFSADNELRTIDKERNHLGNTGTGRNRPTSMEPNEADSNLQLIPKDADFNIITSKCRSELNLPDLKKDDYSKNSYPHRTCKHQKLNHHKVHDFGAQIYQPLPVSILPAITSSHAEDKDRSTVQEEKLMKTTNSNRDNSEEFDFPESRDFPDSSDLNLNTTQDTYNQHNLIGQRQQVLKAQDNLDLPVSDDRSKLALDIVFREKTQGDDCDNKRVERRRIFDPG